MYVFHSHDLIPNLIHAILFFRNNFVLLISYSCVNLQFQIISNMDELMKLKLSWKRPPNMPWPKTWHRFEATSKNGIVYKIKIQDIPPNRFEDVVNFMAAEYSKREPITS